MKSEKKGGNQVEKGAGVEDPVDSSRTRSGRSISTAYINYGGTASDRGISMDYARLPVWARTGAYTLSITIVAPRGWFLFFCFFLITLTFNQLNR